MKRNKKGRFIESHGMCFTPEYVSWASMKKRCLNPDSTHGKYLGLLQYKPWIDSFESFYKDMGPKPSPKHTIERIDNTKGYFPENCRWATKQEQARNTRQCHLLTFNGETRCLTDWAAHFSLSPNTLTGRLKKGWSIDKALTTPAKSNNDIEFNGTTATLSQWARQLGISRAALRWRLCHWTLDKAL